MALYLVQHGKCLSKTEDPSRPLSQEGISEVKRIAEVAKGYRVKIGRIKHSGKTRARQTAELFHSIVGSEEGVCEIDGMAPLDDVQDIAKNLASSENLMLVGHLPFMERLASYLVTGQKETPIFRFQNGGIVCLEQFQDTNAWAIKWTLMPSIG